MNKVVKIIIECIPILVMIWLIPLISNDYLLMLLYVLIIAICFYIKKNKNDFLFLSFGFFVMLTSELIFISAGVEKFVRHTLFGMMPLWLPFLWAYAFVVMRRSIKIIEG